MTQQIKALTSKPESISGPTRWKRTDSHTLPSDLHVHTVAHIYNVTNKPFLFPGVTWL